MRVKLLTGRESSGQLASHTQFYTVSRQGAKPAMDMVHQVITEKSMTKVLVFTHSNETVHRLALVREQLGHKVGGLSIKGRKKVFSKLNRGVFDVVV